MSLIHGNRYYIVAIITKALDTRGSNNTHLFFILINLKVQNQGTVRMGVVKAPPLFFAYGRQKVGNRILGSL